jgi:hemolysin III
VYVFLELSECDRAREIPRLNADGIIMSHCDSPVVAAEPYSRPEEIAHSLTAGLGVAAMLLGIPWLVVRAAENPGAWRVIGALAFGCGGLLMFATSTLYHAVRRPTVKAMLRRLDHSAIYLLIAGTYTPFTIGVVRGSLGWSLLGSCGRSR